MALLITAALCLSGCGSKEMRLCKKIMSTGIADGCEEGTSKYGGATSAVFRVPRLHVGKGADDFEGKLWAFQDPHSYNEVSNGRFDKPYEKFLNGQSLVEVVIYGDMTDDEKSKVEAVVTSF